MFFLLPITLLSAPVMILVCAAVIPAVVLLVKVYRADKIEQEPLPLVLSLIGLGVLSTFCASITEMAGQRLILLFAQKDSVLYNVFLYFAVVALSEEGFKFFFLKRRTWYSPDFNYSFDGVVYAVSVGIGFALFENIQYVFSYGLSTALVRAVTAVPGHACFAVFMGTWYGMARKYINRNMAPESGRCLVMAVVVPVLLHGTYDYIASMQGDYSWIAFVAFILLMFYMSNRLVMKDAGEDTYIG